MSGPASGAAVHEFVPAGQPKFAAAASGVSLQKSSMVHPPSPHMCRRPSQ